MERRVARSEKTAALLQRQLRRARIRVETGASHLCLHCDGPHRTKFCPKIPPSQANAKPSRSEQAARLAHAEHISLHEAADRFGITHQAVSQIWRKMFPNELRGRGTRADHVAHATVVEMVRLGTPLANIAEATGYVDATVYKLARDNGLAASTDPSRARAFQSAIAAVKAGASIGEAAADHGVSWGRLSERCRELGVAATATSKGRNGRAVAAAGLVLTDGISVADAARRMRCSPPAVSVALARMRRMTR